jgi:hypothetical protein
MTRWSRGQEPDKADEVIQKVLEPRRPTRGSADYDDYKASFDNMPPERISLLKHNENIGICLRSAWEEVRRSIPVNQKEERDMKIDRCALNRFEGFVEGRLDCEIPAWWRQALLSACASGRDAIGFDAPRKQPSHAGREGFSARVFWPLVNADRPFVIELNDEKVEIPQATIKEMDGPDTFVADVLLTNRRVYFAWHRDCTIGFTLYSIDRSSKKVQWHNLVCPDGGGIFYSGVTRHCVTIIGQKDRVVLFGAGELCIYVAAFSKTDGSSLFQFSSRY